MALINPYPQREHKVFSRTFLQQTEVNVKFTPALVAPVFRERFIPFAKKYFGFDISLGADSEANHARLDANGEEKQYTFDLDAARIIVGPRSYESFAATILPLIPRLQAYLSNVAQVDSLVELNIVKRNVWPIKANDAYASFTAAMGYIFNEELISDMKSYKFPEKDPQPVQLSKMWADDICENAKLNTTIMAEAHNETDLFFELSMCAAVSAIPVSDISADAVVLNDIIYSKFIDVVTNDIIDLMSSEK